jgi:hypothetical protein
MVGLARARWLVRFAAFAIAIIGMQLVPPHFAAAQWPNPRNGEKERGFPRHYCSATKDAGTADCNSAIVAFPPLWSLRSVPDSAENCSNMLECEAISS